MNPPTSTTPPSGGTPGESKLMELADAVRRFIAPGAWIHLAYGGGRPNAAVAEIVRQHAGTRSRFRVSAHGFVNTQHALIAAGLVDHLCVAFAGENYPAPRPNPVLQRALAAHELTLENWSIWSLTARLMAGALGLEGYPVRSLARSGMAAEHEPDRYREVDLFGTPSGIVSALRPDVVLVQAVAADRDGNVVLAAPYGEGHWGALAARSGVIACVEEVVDTELIRRHSSWPGIPGHVVRAVCHTPRGSHPYGLWAGGFPGVADYVEDDAFMAETRRAARTPEDFAAWMQTWIAGVNDHAGYRRALAARPAPPPVRAAGEPADTCSTEEYMTVVAARIIHRRVRTAGHDSVLAGIGFSHLAAWAAAETLREEGVAVELLAELGMAGFRPLAGDPYLFASQNLPTCTRLTDVETVLGTAVGGPATSCLGVLGAGEVDAAGNLNSTWSRDGRFLLGSGGANDVASAADELIVVLRQDPERMVSEVGYITAPGHRVSTIVTSEAIFERGPTGFEVTGWLGDPELARDTVADRLRERTGWPIALRAGALEHQPAPSAGELARLRAFDPEGTFLHR